MSKISRATQKIFGSSGGAANFAEFGSLAAGSPATYSGSTITPAIIQTLANYLEGWFGAIVGENSPAIEDMNSLFYLITYQLAYLFQAGIAEWDAGTTYYIGSLVTSGSATYRSLTYNNLNNAVSSTANWQNVSGGANLVSINPSIQSPYALAASDLGKTFLVNSANGAMQFNLPVPYLNYRIKVKDSAGSAGTNNITMHRNGSETFEGLAADYVAQANFGEWEIASDGTNWFIIGR